MSQPISAIKATPHLTDLKRGDERDRDPVAVVGEPGVKAALPVKSLIKSILTPFKTSFSVAKVIGSRFPVKSNVELRSASG